MMTRFALIPLCAGLLWLGGCDKTPKAPSTPAVVEPATGGPGTASGSIADPSVPSAASVFPPADGTKSDPTLGRSNRAMSATQESTAMPMPGQNNDHSAPLSPARRASSP